MSHDFDLPRTRHASEAERSVDTAALAAQWEAVQEAGAAVGQLAQLAMEEPGEDLRTLPERAAKAGGTRLELVARGVDDLAAVLRPGLRALLELSGKGRDTTAAALALWREFHRARAALVALAA